MFALRLVTVNLSNCCKMKNATLIVSMYWILQVTVTNVNKKIDSNVIDKFTAISP